MKIERIKCPPLNLTKEERIKFLLEQLENFVNSPYMANLVENFGDKIPEGITFLEKINWLNNFAEDNWNYRAKQKETERWNVTEVVHSNYENILESVKALGLYFEEEVLEEPNHILILGGAINSNNLRPELAKKVVDNNSLQKTTVIALSTNRKLSDNEFGSNQNYPGNVSTEFESLTQGTKLAFELGSTEIVKSSENENPFLEMKIVKFGEDYNNNRIYSVSAPSSDPNRRANSRDTFDCYLENFTPKGENVLLITTNLYVPYQLLASLDLAIDHDFYVDCIGLNPGNQDNLALFLQELKAAINQVYRLVNKYKNYLSD